MCKQLLDFYLNEHQGWHFFTKRDINLNILFFSIENQLFILIDLSPDR
jgi:hypothetical protein